MSENPGPSSTAETIDLGAALNGSASLWVGQEYPAAGSLLPLLRKRAGLLAESPDDAAQVQESRVPDPQAWPAGAVLGARVLLQGGWGRELTGVIWGVLAHGERTEFTVRVPGGSKFHYDEHGQWFSGVRMDFFEPVRVLSSGDGNGRGSSLDAPALGNLNARVPRLARIWPAGAQVGQVVLLENSWAVQEFGVVEAVSGRRSGDLAFTVRRPGGEEATYDAYYTDFSGTQVDDFCPVWVMTRPALWLWALRQWRTAR